MMPTTAPQPNLVPQQLKRQRSNRYARRLTFVRILASSSVSPGGKAFLFFLVVLITPSRVAGTFSKYGSSAPNLFLAVSLKTLLPTYFAMYSAIAKAKLCQVPRRKSMERKE